MRKRASISIDPHVHSDAARLAKKRGISVSGLVEEALRQVIAQSKKPAERDPAFVRVPLPKGANPPADLSERHDWYFARAISR